jgi:hypothetical protein
MEAVAREEITQEEMAALSANQAGKAGQVVVLGPQSLPRRDVCLSRSDIGQSAGAGQSDGSATDAASATNGQSGKLATSPVSSVSDVGAQAAATLATLESDRAAVGATHVQIQQLARLAVAAYGM